MSLCIGRNSLNHIVKILLFIDKNSIKKQKIIELKKLGESSPTCHSQLLCFFFKLAYLLNFDCIH